MEAVSDCDCEGQASSAVSTRNASSPLCWFPFQFACMDVFAGARRYLTDSGCFIDGRKNASEQIETFPNSSLVIISLSSFQTLTVAKVPAETITTKSTHVPVDKRSKKSNSVQLQRFAPYHFVT